MASILSIDVNSSRQLQAVVLALHTANNNVAKNIRQWNQRIIQPEWKKGVTERAYTHQEQMVLAKTATVAVSDRNVALRAGGGRRLFENEAQGVEFGANRYLTKSHRGRSRKGRSYQVKDRHTQRQFVQTRQMGPTYNTASDMIPRIAALWVSTTVRMYRDAFEGKAS